MLERLLQDCLPASAYDKLHPQTHTQRAAVYKQIDRIIMEEDASFFPICNDLNLVVLSPKVKGFVNPPEEWFQLWTPWVEA